MKPESLVCVISIALACLVAGAVAADSPLPAGEEKEIPPTGPDILPPLQRPRPPQPGIAAEVAEAKIMLDQVFEVWGPAWYEAVAEVRRGRLAMEECDRRLQAEWEKSLETVIREEIFYQEAKRETEKLIQRLADQFYEVQSAYAARRREPSPSRNAVEAEVRRRYQRTAERQLNDLVDRYIKASGGIERLKQVLANRGINWEEWRRRLERKAYTNTYLHEALSPLVPREPRPADIREYYQQHKDEFVEPGKVSFRHILFAVQNRGNEDAARLAAENVYRAIAEGRLTFEEAARKHSDDAASRERGGIETDLAPEPEREAWLQNIREAVRKEKEGEIGPILVSPLGCHLVMLVSVEPSKAIPFNEAQRIIAKRMFARKWEEEVQKLYVELKAKTRVRILAERFPPELSCSAALQTERRAPAIYGIGPSAIPPATSSAPTLPAESAPTTPSLPEIH